MQAGSLHLLLAQGLPLAQVQVQSHALVQSHDQANQGDQQQENSSCLQWYWVQVRLHEKKWQQVMVVGKKRLRGAVETGDEMVLQVKVEDVMVALVLPPVEGEEQREVVG